jgi:hypothetical protein
MSTQIQRRRGTTAEHSTFTGVEGELTVDTTKDTAVVHDGTTVGGHPLQKQYPPLGSAAAPTYTFTGDTNTGIYSPGADQVAVATSGTGRLFVNSAGLVGIGTSSPPQQLSVHSASTTDGRIEAHGIIARDNWGSASGLGNGMFSPASNTLAFTTNSTERCRLDSSGRLGIGTSSPSSKLHVLGDATNYGITSEAPSGYGALNIKQTGGNSISLGMLSNNLFFYDNTAGLTRLTLDSSGRLGIGTSSPTATLDCNGSIRAISTTPIIPSSGTGLEIYYANGTFTGTPSAYLLSYDRTGSAYRPINIDASEHVFRTTGNEKARLDSSGRLLVGTSSAPTGFTGAKVVVQGNTSNPAGSAELSLQRGTAVATIVNNDNLGGITFGDSAGYPFASIRGDVDGTPGTNDYPGRLTFSTTSDGASSPTERVRISSDGIFQIGATTFTKSTAGGFAVSSTVGTGQGAANSGSLAYFNETNSGNGAGLWIGAYTDQTTAVIGSNTATGNIAFQTYNGGWGERMRLTYDGKFLVGTSTGSSRLSIAGTADNANSEIQITATGVASGYIGANSNGLNIGTDTAGLVFKTGVAGGGSVGASGTERMRIQSDGNIGFFNTPGLYPNSDNGALLGFSAFRWSAVWAANGTIQTSDQRAKAEITGASLGADFIKALRPVSYKWIEGGKVDSGKRDEDGNFIYESVPGKRTHWGFIAQEVKQAVDDAGVDFGGWVLTDKDDPDSQQALRYDQFIAPLTKALQEAIAKIETLEGMVAVNNITIDEQQHQLSTLAARLTALESA